MAAAAADGSGAPPPTATLAFPDRGAPLGVLLAAQLAGLALDARVDPKLAKSGPPVLTAEGGEQLTGLASCARYVGRTACADVGLYGNGSPVQAVQVDAWLDFAASHLKPGPGLAAAVRSLNAALALRTYLVGRSLTLADTVCWGCLQATGQWCALRKAAPHAARWHAHVAEAATGATALAEAHGLAFKSAAEVAAERVGRGLGGGDTGSFDVGLPGAVQGAVVTRFPPEPSGYLHVGHAKAALLNDYFARHYKGKLLVRFDDTNPSKESHEFQQSILDDLGTLGITWDKLSYTSDYFPQMLDLAERLIQAGHLYADDTPVDRMREERMDGIESARRGRPADESLAVWKEMVAGTAVGKANCLRFRMDMANPNKALRDPVAYRCNDTPHWRTGDKYKVYPTYDLACPFVDALEGVTHALRTSEYRDREPQFQRALAACQAVWPGLGSVAIWDYSRLAFAGTVMSKRKLLWFVETGRVDGWDDPRFPTVRGVLRRGLTVPALRDFILSQGASRNVTLQDFDRLWATNKAAIDPACPRHSAVREAGAVLLTLADGPEVPEVVQLPRHKKNPELGTKSVYRTKRVWLDATDAAAVREGEEVTLMDWGNAVVERLEVGPDGAIAAAHGRLHLDGSVKATRLKLTWLPDDPSAPLTPLTLVDFGDLLTKRKLDEGDDVADFANPASKSEEAALGDPGVAALPAGSHLQLERVGYFRVDVAAGSGQRAVLFRVPEGKKAGGVGGKAPPPGAAA